MSLSDLYLSDGLSQIDYVVVYNEVVVTKRRYFKRIFENLLSQLDEFQIDYEQSTSVVSVLGVKRFLYPYRFIFWAFQDNENIHCLKIHVPSYILEEYADFHHVEINYKNQSPDMGDYFRCCRCLHTILTVPTPKSMISDRLRYVTYEKLKGAR